VNLRGGKKKGKVEIERTRIQEKGNGIYKLSCLIRKRVLPRTGEDDGDERGKLRESEHGGNSSRSMGVQSAYHAREQQRRGPRRDRTGCPPGRMKGTDQKEGQEERG